MDDQVVVTHKRRLLGAISAVYFGFGLIIGSIAPMLEVVRRDLSMSASQMGFALGSWALLFIGTAPIAGRLVDRFGLRLAVSLGGLSVFASALARSWATGAATLWCAVAIFGLGGPLISTGVPTLVRNHFDDPAERKRAIGLALVSPTLGTIVALVATNSVLLPWLGDWRSVLRLEAFVVAVATIVWFFVAASATAGGFRRHDADGHRNARADLRALVASAGVRFALATAFSTFFVNHALNGWLPTVLGAEGPMRPTAASTVAALATAGGVIFALAVPRVVPAIRRERAIGALFCTVGVGLVLITVGGTVTVIGALIAGIRSALMPLGLLVLMDDPEVTAGRAGLANGTLFAVGEVGGAAGPLAVGILADSGVGYQGAMVGIGMVVAVTGVASFAMPWRGR